MFYSTLSTSTSSSYGFLLSLKHLMREYDVCFSISWRLCVNFSNCNRVTFLDAKLCVISLTLVLSYSDPCIMLQYGNGLLFLNTNLNRFSFTQIYYVSVDSCEYVIHFMFSLFYRNFIAEYVEYC